MLMNENFTYNEEIDIFEGGPILNAKTTSIRSVKQSALAEIEITTDPLEEQSELILGNEQLDFRACFGKIQMIKKGRGLINEVVAEALKVKNGDVVRYIASH